MKKINLILKTVVLLCVLAACKKGDEEFVNLKSTLSAADGTTEKTVEEGDPLILTLELEDELSEDLVLQGKFSNSAFNQYTNDEDFSTSLEYSSDGENWLSESDKSLVRFKSQTKKLNVRIKTVDDDIPEVEEHTNFELTINTANSDLDITNNLQKFTLKLTDNEDVERGIDAEDRVLMYITLNSDGSHKIKSLTDDKLNSKFEKEIIDDLYKKPLEDVIAINKIVPETALQVKQFEVLAGDEDLGGYVYNDITATSGDIWNLGMNLEWAYKDIVKGGARIAYNETGHFGNILTHELGHILTLNFEEQISFDSDGSCTNFKLSDYATGVCANDNSHINEFFNGFYSPAPTNIPVHVTPYASFNIYEDLAETFAQMVIQKDIPASTTENSGALQKLNFLKGRELYGFKSKINDLIKTEFLLGRSVLSYNIGKDGKGISCLHPRHKK